MNRPVRREAKILIEIVANGLNSIEKMSKDFLFLYSNFEERQWNGVRVGIETVFVCFLSWRNCVFFLKKKIFYKNLIMCFDHEERLDSSSLRKAVIPSGHSIWRHLEFKFKRNFLWENRIFEAHLLQFTETKFIYFGNNIWLIEKR